MFGNLSSKLCRALPKGRTEAPERADDAVVGPVRLSRREPLRRVQPSAAQPKGRGTVAFGVGSRIGRVSVEVIERQTTAGGDDRPRLTAPHPGVGDPQNSPVGVPRGGVQVNRYV